MPQTHTADKPKALKLSILPLISQNIRPLIDIILTNNENHLLYTEGGDPFLNQEVRYHCTVFGILNFTKPKRKSYLRHTWSYDRGDFNLLREKASRTNWERIYDQNFSKQVQRTTEHIIDISKACIPNRLTRVQPDEPPWMNTSIKHYIRLRKRAYRKAKQTNTIRNWTKFNALRNKVISMIRDLKGKSNENIANKLKSDTLSAKDWWSTLKTVVSPNRSNSLSPLDNDGQIITDDVDKAYALNDYFRDQTLINDTEVEVPDVIQHNVAHELRSLILTPAEIEVILKSLPNGKAVGPDGISNQILRELATDLSYPFCSLFYQSLQTELSLILGNYQTCVLSLKQAIVHLYPIFALCIFYPRLKKSLNERFSNMFLITSETIVYSLRYCLVLFQVTHTVNQLTYLYNAFSQALDFVRVVFCDIS